MESAFAREVKQCLTVAPTGPARAGLDPATTRRDPGNWGHIGTRGSEACDFSAQSRRRDLNPRPIPYEGIALPAELLRHYRMVVR